MAAPRNMQPCNDATRARSPAPAYASSLYFQRGRRVAVELSDAHQGYILPRARRRARARRARRPALPRGGSRGARRISRRLYLLHALRFSHHPPAPGRPNRVRHHRPPTLLDAPLPAAHAGEPAWPGPGLATVATPLETRARLSGDVLAALLYVSNWRFMRTAESYFAIFEHPSPVQHLAPRSRGGGRRPPPAQPS